MLRLIKVAIIAICALSPLQSFAATTILPNAEQCFSGLSGTTGMVGLLGTITGGSGGTTGTYGGIALTGGSGSGATANITVSGGAVTTVSILNPGSQYVIGDVLSASAASIGNATGFSVPISSISLNSSLAGGSVTFYVPNTQTFKQTWRDASQSVLNTNPVTLDANGCMIAYGTGIYRQIVKDSLGNTLYDQLTTDTSAFNSTFWAGVSGGTPNVITVVDAGFNGTDGTIINFIALATNTGPVTLNPSGYGAIPVLKGTTAGPVSLTGGEIIQSNTISVIYVSSTNSFILINPPIQSASGATAPLCGASGLKIVNNGSAPNSTINVTANQAVMQSTGGLVINRSNISVALNISTGTVTTAANGMDGEAPSTNNWIYIWLVDNGSATASLGSLESGNALAPNLPSGYIYKCRVGAFQVDGSGNLYRMEQRGQNVWYVITAGTNTAIPINLVNSAAGTYSTTSPVLATFTVSGGGFCTPLTATRASVLVANRWKGNALSSILIAPSTSWGGTNNGPRGSNGVIWPYVPSAEASELVTLGLEAVTLAWASDTNGAAVSCYGYMDAVNAN